MRSGPPTGGVIAMPNGRIRFDFAFDGRRYRPSILRPPTEGNLRRAREQLVWIRRSIVDGTFCFEEEFPNFRLRGRAASPLTSRTCNQVFDRFLAHSAARVRIGDMASSTRKILDGSWRPVLGRQQLRSVKHSGLLDSINRQTWKKKSYNNAVSVLRAAFELGFEDFPECHNPAASLKCYRLRKRDRRIPDPFSIQEAETLIAALHADWGSAQGNYDEFRLFTGLRPSEQIALTTGDFDSEKRLLNINKARVDGAEKDCTKTYEDRQIELSPRAAQILIQQLEMREQLMRRGQIDHELLFFEAAGAPVILLSGPYRRWRRTLSRLNTIRYRRPYEARYCSISWNLMMAHTTTHWRKQ